MTPALVIYDANCPVCRRAQSWLARHALPGALEYVGCQTEERARRAPQISESACMEAMQLVLENGRSYAATEAFEHLLPRLRAPWRYLAWGFKVPGVRQTAPLFYRLIARNRMALAGLLEKKSPAPRCGPDKDCS